jgi:rubrerythrin
MSETFDNDLEAYLKKNEDIICSECGYVGPFYEFEFGICPICKTDISKNPNDEYDYEYKLF